jgi:predicted glycosyltransferase
MASIRDILQRRTDHKNRLTVETIQHYYDAVLVHADERLFTLDASFPLSAEIEDRLFYTGYIHQSQHANAKDSGLAGQGEIIVSGGSGTVSARLIETARQAKPLSVANKHVWRLLTGRGTPRTTKSNDPGLIIEANRPDFVTLLGRCALSVSQAGYNTTLDILSTGARSVMVPFAGDGETEQTDRAQALQRAGRIIQITELELTPKRLAHAIDSALDMTPVKIRVDLNGAANSAKFISQKLSEWQARCSLS